MVVQKRGILLENKINELTSYGKYHIFKCFIHQWFMSLVMDDHTFVSNIPFNSDKELVQQMIPFFEYVEEDQEEKCVQTAHMTKKAMTAIYKSLQDKKWSSCYLEIFSFFENSQNQYMPIDFESVRTTISFYKDAVSQPIESNEFISKLRKDYEYSQFKEEIGVYLIPPTLIITEKKVNQILNYFSQYGVRTKLDVLPNKRHDIYQLDGISIWFD